MLADVAIDPRVSNRNNCTEEFTKALTHHPEWLKAARRNLTGLQLGRLHPGAKKDTAKDWQLDEREAKDGVRLSTRQRHVSARISQETSTFSFSFL
jgi:hypothetical protein